jgi:hypothetical protein
MPEDEWRPNLEQTALKILTKQKNEYAEGLQSISKGIFKAFSQHSRQFLQSTSDISGANRYALGFSITEKLLTVITMQDATEIYQLLIQHSILDKNGGLNSRYKVQKDDFDFVGPVSTHNDSTNRLPRNSKGKSLKELNKITFHSTTHKVYVEIVLIKLL